MSTIQAARIAVAMLACISRSSFGQDRIDERPMPTNGAEIRMECYAIARERIAQRNFAGQNPANVPHPDYRIKVQPSPRAPPTKEQAESNLQRLDKRSADVGCVAFQQCVGKCAHRTDEQLNRPPYAYCDDMCGRETLSRPSFSSPEPGQ